MKKFGQKIRLLYLNCIHGNTEQVLKLLRKSDYQFEIHFSLGLADFQSRVKSVNPEMILADHSVKSACQIEAIEVIRQSGLNMPLMLITDFESEEFASILMKGGVSDYVFIERPDRLPMAIASLVETHRSLNLARAQADQSRREFSSLVEDLPVGLSIWNKDRQLVYFNQALTELAFDGNDGIYDQWRKITLDIYDGNNNPVSVDRDILQECLRDGRRVVVDDLYVAKKDGSKRFVSVVATPTKGANGQNTGATILFFDGTTQKLAQMKTRALSDLLNTKNQELGQFAFVISHNLRDPIAKILGLASICDTSTDEARFIVRKIVEEANRLDSVVKDLNVIVSVRNVEKEKRESLEFDHEYSLVSQVLKREINDSKAMIETDFRELREVYTVKSYLHSVMYNLLSNSIKYRDSRKPLTIKMRTFQTGQYICLSVKDNGLGIDLNKNGEKIFGMYKRFHSDNIPGKGVGLHFIKSYAEALGGKVEIDSQLHEGTELKVYFPNNHNHDSQ